MPLTEHVEPIVDACIATLRLELNSSIDEINLEGNGPLELEHVAADAYHAGGLVSAPSIGWPFVEVSVSDATYSNASIGQAIWVSSATAYVSLWCRNVDDELLYRSTLRYGRALLSSLLARGAFGPELYADTVSVRYRRNPSTPTDAEALEACALIVCTLGGDDVPS